MKKTVFMLVGVAAMLVACNNGKPATATATEDSTATATTEATATGDTLTYKGEGPAADGTYEYTLSLYGDGEAALVEVGTTPQGRDTLAMTTGLVNVIEKDGKTYYRVSENKVDSLTFLKLDDSTLRKVNDALETPADEKLATDLKLVK